MRTLTVLLPNLVIEKISAEAAKQRVDISALCSGVLAEHFLAGQEVIMETNAQAPSQPRPSETTAQSGDFNVRKHFSNFPARSVELAQRFVDEALKIPNVSAFRAFSGRGVGIKPNFVFVEYLQKRAPGGVAVSFYGGPEKHSHARLVAGRNPNYSRAVVTTTDELNSLLREIGRSYELKYGRRPPGRTERRA